MGCLQSKQEQDDRNPDSLRSSLASNGGEDTGPAAPTATSEAVFSSAMDDLFANVLAESVVMRREGTLMKLGGRNKDRWDESTFELKNTGLYWGMALMEKNLTQADITSASIAQHMGDFACFEVFTSVKQGKAYKLRATSHEECDQWIEAINSLVQGGAVATRQGTLLKLGGQSRDKWDKRCFQLTKQALRWGNSEDSMEHELKASDIISAAKTQMLTIATRVKKGKAYKLASADHEELALWQEGITEYASSGRVSQMREAPFLKLGGRNKNTWQERTFCLDSTHGVSWGEFQKKDSELMAAEIKFAAANSEGFQGKPSFMIMTHTKDNKVYKFSALTEELRDGWVNDINAVATSAAAKVSQIALEEDEGLAEEEADPEEQAKLEREKLERRAARKANMAAKRAKAKSQMAFVNANGLETPSVDREV